jgi:hypothetical protein
MLLLYIHAARHRDVQADDSNRALFLVIIKMSQLQTFVVLGVTKLLQPKC